MFHVELAMMSRSKYVEMYQRNSAPMCRDSLVEMLLPNLVLIFLTLCAKMSLEKNANQSRRPNVRMFHVRFVSRLRENIARLFQGKRLLHASRTIVGQLVQDQSCRQVPRQACEQKPQQVTNYVDEQVCGQVPEEQCRDE